MTFAADTELVAVGPGRHQGAVSRDWWILAGPNGGFLAALLVRAIEAEVDQRALRSLTVHYLRPPVEGPVEIHVGFEKQGRSVDFVSARMLQGDRPIAVALAALAGAREGIELRDWPMPDVVPPAEGRPLAEVRAMEPLPIHRQWDMRLVDGGPLFAGVDEALLSWWIRPAPHHPLDAALVVALTDALPPPVFARRTEPVAAPTVDLTVHVRADLAEVAWEPGDWVLARFVTRWGAGGFLEEDGELWLADGTLLAHSRQLALGN